MPVDAPPTPPAFVLQLEKRVAALERAAEASFGTQRDLASKIDKNHVVMIDNFGELARMLRAVVKQLKVKL